MSKFVTGRSMFQSYEGALKALCGLQSNRASLGSSLNQYTNLSDMEKYLHRSGLNLNRLDELSIIHVTGTKGKGSTCAYVESILRKQNYKTGFFSSPHLVSVRERIRIDGVPLNKSTFAHYFWRLYNKLDTSKETPTDMPMYFKFFTLLMFQVFLEVKVDVAIIEVGIGGELDSTNIIKNPICVGITSIALDHTSLLGSTLEEIAYQKSGIFKPKSIAYALPQSSTIMNVLKNRALERDCQLNIINPPFVDIGQSRAQNCNASLAVELARCWMKIRGTNNNVNNSNQTIIQSLLDCRWPGRTQILQSSFAKFYLDGAHTLESLLNCVEWFETMTKNRENRLLIFNTSGSRDPIPLLNLLKPLNFDGVYFVPNDSGIRNTDNQFNCRNQSQLNVCRENCRYWNDEERTRCKDNIVQAFKSIKESNVRNNHILVTGSLHLVGAVLDVLDPDLTMTTSE